MAMYYYARKLQLKKGAKVSTPSFPSTQQRSYLTHGRKMDFHQGPTQSCSFHGEKEFLCHCHTHHHHCCPAHHHPSCCHQTATQHCCGPGPSVLSPCQQCSHNNPVKVNGGIGMNVSRSLHNLDLEQLDLNGESSPQPSQSRFHISHHPPCCSMLHKSESQYDNAQGISVSSPYLEGEGLVESYVGTSKEQEEETVEVEESGPNANDHKSSLRHSFSNSTLTEDQFHLNHEGTTDDDLDNEIQEIYYRKRVSNKGFPFQENYQEGEGRSRKLEQEELCPSLCCGTKGQLLSGSWEAILEKLVFPWVDEGYPNIREDEEAQETLFAFLLCSRLQQAPHLTMKSVFKHFLRFEKASSSSESFPEKVGSEDQANGDDNGDEADSKPDVEMEEELNLQKARLPFLLRFIRVWTELLPHDFRDDRLMYYVRLVRDVAENADPETNQEALNVMDLLASKLTTLELFESTLRRYKTESSIGEPIAAPSVTTICPSPATMAEQLSLVELEYFSFLGPQELVAQLLRKDRARLKDYSRMNGSVPSSRSGTLVRCATIGTCTASDKDIPGRFRAACCGVPTSDGERVEAESNTRVLDAFISWFHRLALFVASEICKMAKKKARCRVIEYWIQVGKECLTIRNFNSLMAILAGLSCRPVARLKKTWGKINCADLIELQTAMDPKNNFSAYRAMYKASVWNSQSMPGGEIHNYKILVPYLALLLRDVYNLNTLIPSKIKLNGHVNFEKYTSMCKLVKEIVSWNSMAKPFDKIPSIFNAVQALPIYTEEEVTSASYGCEEPDGSAEKEHFNRLKRDHNQRVAPLLSKGQSPKHYLI